MVIWYQNNKVVKYVIKETNTGLGGITYAKDIPVTVTVKDNLDGTISATTNIAKLEGDVAVVDVTNIYATKDVEVTLEATKKINGRDLQNGEFKFAINDVDNNTVVQSNATNDANGNVVFEKLTFNTVGTYNYVVYENEVDGNGVTVDTTEYKVTIVVTDNLEGQLVAVVKVNDTEVDGSTADVIKFNNKYITAGQITITGEKKLDGRDLAAEEFAFELYDADGNLVKTARNDADGKIIFTAIDIDKADEYIYTVKEVNGTDDTITYDETVYTVKVTVTDNGDGTLKLEYAYAKQNDLMAESVVFENKYTEPTPNPEPTPSEPTLEPQPQPEPKSQPESPKTGDSENLTAWFAVVFISGVMIFATGKKLRRLSK